MQRTPLLFLLALLLMVSCNENNRLDNSVPAGAEDFVEYYTVKHVVDITYKGDEVLVNNPIPSQIDVMVVNGHVVANATADGVEYRLSGQSPDGSFKLYSVYKCQLTLDGVTLHNPIGSAINIQSGKRIFVVLSDGKVNSLSDDENYALVDGEAMKGTFFSEGQLIFSGQGRLEVESNYRHGICSDDYLHVRSGNIVVSKSVRDAMHCKDYFIGDGGNVTLHATDDGIDVKRGYITINGGEYDIYTVDKGITTSYDSLTDTSGGTYDVTLRIAGGNIAITTTGERAHGIESIGDVYITGGAVNIVAPGLKSDGIQAAKTIFIEGGEVKVQANDDCTSGVLQHTAGTLECL